MRINVLCKHCDHLEKFVDIGWSLPFHGFCNTCSRPYSIEYNKSIQDTTITEGFDFFDNPAKSREYKCRKK